MSASEISGSTMPRTEHVSEAPANASVRWGRGLVRLWMAVSLIWTVAAGVYFWDRAYTREVYSEIEFEDKSLPSLYIAKRFSDQDKSLQTKVVDSILKALKQGQSEGVVEGDRWAVVPRNTPKDAPKKTFVVSTDYSIPLRLVAVYAWVPLLGGLLMGFLAHWVIKGFYPASMRPAAKK